MPHICVSESALLVDYSIIMTEYGKISGSTELEEGRLQHPNPVSPVPTALPDSAK